MSQTQPPVLISVPWDHVPATVAAHVRQERDEQDRQGFTPYLDMDMTVHAWAAVIARHLGLAMPHTSLEEPEDERFYRQMIRLSAVTQAAAEATLRKRSAPKRKVAGEYESGSGF